MVATVGSISIDLSTNSVKFAAGFKASATTVERESARMAKAVGGVTKLMKGFGLGGLLGFGALSGIRSAVAEVAQLGDIADKVGVSVENLQRLQIGFEQAGAEAGAVESVLTEWGKRIADANLNGGQLADIFRANGIAITDSAGHLRDSVELMRDYSGLIENATSDQDRLLLSSIAFGKANADAVNALKGGPAAFDAMMKAADDTGAVIDKEMVKRADDIDKKFNQIARTIGTMLKSAVIESVGVLDDAGRNLNQGFAELARMQADFAPTAAIREMQTEIAKVETALANLKAEGAEAFQWQIDRRTEELEILNRKLTELFKTSRANLAQRFRAAENASMRMLDALGGQTNVPTNLRGNARFTQQVINGVRVTSFGNAGDASDGKADERWGQHRSLLEKQTDATRDGFDESTSATDRAGSTVSDSVYGGTGNVVDRVGRLDDSMGRRLDTIAGLMQTVGSAITNRVDVSATGFGSLSGQRFTFQREPIGIEVLAGKWLSEISRDSLLGGSSNPFSIFGGGSDAGAATGAAPQIVINYNAAAGESEVTQRQNARKLGELINRETARL